MRLDGVLLVAAFALAGTLLPAAPLAVCVAAVGVLVLALRRAAFPWLLLASCLFCATGLRATKHVASFDALRVWSRDKIGAPTRCELSGKISASPTQMAGEISSIVTAERIACESVSLDGPLKVRLRGGPTSLARGDSVSAIVDLGALEIYRNAGAQNTLAPAARNAIVLTGKALSLEVTESGRGIQKYIDHYRARVRARILATYAPDAQTLGRALVLGENDLSDEDDHAFKHSGLSHLLAVSGTHLVFAVVFLVQALKFLLVRCEFLARAGDVGRIAAAMGAVLSLAYADFAGGSGSAWRAAWMLCAAFGVQCLGYRTSGVRSLALSVLVGAVCDPLCGTDISFLLSIAATCGLMCISRPLAMRANRIANRALRYLAQSLSATLGAMLGCAPLLALLGSELTLASIFANVIAGPLGEAVALPLCLLHTISAALPTLEHGVALCASGALLVVRAIAHQSASFSAISLALLDPHPFQLAVLTFGIAGFLLSKLRVVWALALVIGLLSLEREVKELGAPSGALRMTALDVGQGDATLIDFPDGRVMLVDAGGSVMGRDPGARAVLPVLRARRRTFIDVVVLSHPHPDHFAGLVSVIKEVEVGEFWDSGQGAVEGAGPVYAELMRELARRKIPIRKPAELCGDERLFGGAKVEVLGPCPQFTPGRNANDNSLVLRVSLGKRRILLAGDAEEEEERELVESARSRLSADVLKVGHHGSRTSSSEPFVDAVSPRIATISCGVRNSFGHPHADVLERLSKAQASPLRLDRVGSVIYLSDGSHQELFVANVPQ